MIILYLCKIKITHSTQHITHFQEKMGDKITRMEQGMQRRTENHPVPRQAHGG